MPKINNFFQFAVGLLMVGFALLLLLKIAMGILDNGCSGLSVGIF